MSGFKLGYNFLQLLCVIILCGSSTIFLADGTLDSSFGSSGIVVTPIPGQTTASIGGVYVQADGNIVVTGSNVEEDSDFIVTRYLTNGSLDTSFGTGGIATISLTAAGITSVGATGVAVQSDGRIAIVGTADGLIFASRLNANGSLDTTFNASGSLPGVFVFPQFQVSSFDMGTAIVIDVNEKVVVVGVSDTSGVSAMAIGRLNSNGTLDTTFNSSGQQIVQFAAGSVDGAYAVALQADGETILAAGVSSAGAGASGNPNFAFARLDPDGSIDIMEIALFSTVGNDLLLISGQANVVLAQPNGQIVLGGGVFWVDGNEYFGLARYNSDGTLDTSFVSAAPSISHKPGTFVTPSQGGSAETSVITSGGLQSDGKIVVSGYGPADDATLFMLARFNGLTGSLDTSFVGGSSPTPGFVFTQINVLGGDAIAATSIQLNGNIVTAGVTEVSAGVNDFALTRYLVNDPATPLAPLVIITPSASSPSASDFVTFSGTVQNPSIIDIFVDGLLIGSTVTEGATNAWSFTNSSPLSPAEHTLLVVARYRDDGHLNIEATLTFIICPTLITDPFFALIEELYWTTI
jgi:uncharacterized delta-60 repeat protein